MYFGLLLIPTIVSALCAAGCCVLSYRGVSIKRLGRFEFPKLSDAQYYSMLFTTLAVTQILFFLLSQKLISNFFADTEGAILPIVLFIISFCSSGSVFFSLYSDKQRLYKLFVRCTVLSVVLLLTEVILFNGKSLSSDYEKFRITKENILIETPDTASISENGEITITGIASIILNDIPEYARVIGIESEQPEKTRHFRVQLRMRDDNFSEFYHTVSDKFVGGHGYPCELSFSPYGKVRSLQLSLIEVPGEVVLHSITAMNCVSFRFSAIRYTVLFVFFALILTVLATGFAGIRYDRKNIRHRIAVIAMTAVCVGSSVIFYVSDQQLIDYPLVGGAEYADPYTQVFDAFENNRVWIDVPPDKNLETLENVYDADVRGKSEFGVAWDRAYFEGRYYSYFGVTPVFIFYYPVYLLTGKLPTLAMANGFFGIISILFLCLAILGAVRLFAPKTNLLMLLLMLLTGTCISGAYFCFQRPDMYDVVVASGSCFLCASIWLGLRTCFTRRRWVKLILLALCGLSLGLCAASRPSMAICGLVLAPLFLFILFDKQDKASFKLAQASSFLLPVFAVGAALMYYNYLRFGSPLDFGANYQLTVSDVHANHLRLSALFPAIYHYFLQPTGTAGTFPYFVIQGFFMGNYGMYSYADAMIGAFRFPVLLLGAVLIPESMKVQGNGLVKFRCRGFIIACFVLSILIAWADFCLAGTNVRYLYDIMPLMIIGSVSTILGTAEKGGKLRYRITVAVMILTIIFAWLIMLTDTGLTLAMQHENLYETIEDLVVFWQ